MIRGLPQDPVKKRQARGVQDLNDMNVLEWVKNDVPPDAESLKIGETMKMKFQIEARTRVAMEDYAVQNKMSCVTVDTSVAVRSLLFNAWRDHKERSNVKVALCSVQTEVCLWLVNEVMKGMTTSSNHLGGLVTQFLQDMNVVRGNADAELHRDTKSSSCSRVSR